jgi:arginase family enzyme
MRPMRHKPFVQPPSEAHKIFRDGILTRMARSSIWAHHFRHWRSSNRSRKSGGNRSLIASTTDSVLKVPWVERIIQVGLGGIGGSRAADLADARASGAELVTAAMLRPNGIQQALELIPQYIRCIVTLDYDGLDPSVIPLLSSRSLAD